MFKYCIDAVGNFFGFAVQFAAMHERNALSLFQVQAWAVLRRIGGVPI